MPSEPGEPELVPFWNPPKSSQHNTQEMLGS